MQLITIEQLTTILEESTLTKTTDHAGMLIHNINHPVHGQAVTIQGESGAVLIAK